MSKGLAVVLCEEQHEVLELHYPKLRFEEAGYEVRHDMLPMPERPEDVILGETPPRPRPRPQRLLWAVRLSHTPL